MPISPPIQRGFTAELQERVRPRRKRSRRAPRVALDQRVQVMRQREHDMVVAARQELAAACRDPALLGQRLALGAMAVTAGVVAQGDSTAALTRPRWPPMASVRQASIARMARAWPALEPMRAR